LIPCATLIRARVLSAKPAFSSQTLGILGNADAQLYHYQNDPYGCTGEAARPQIGVWYKKCTMAGRVDPIPPKRTALTEQTTPISHQSS